MTAASPQSVELDEQRAELKSVLESPQFLRAPKLAQLLCYLCEKLFSGQASQIKEYSVGLEVFGRGQSFDQNADSIVRVEANRLRKRLAEYYTGEGASNRLHITIPIGQYVPEFEPGTAARVQQSCRRRPHPYPTSPRSRRSSRLQGHFVPSDLVCPAPGSAWLSRRSFLSRRVCWLSITSAPPPSGKAKRLRRRPRQILPRSWSPTRPSDLRPAMRYASWPAPRAASSTTPENCGAPTCGSTGGTAIKGPAQHIWRTLDPDFYRTSRQGQFRYDIPLKKGFYELRLHFAETTYGPESTGTGGEGSRIMTVRANGAVLLNGFDIAADAGASRTADVKVFPGIEPAGDGKLHLEFTGEDGRQAELSAIEIAPGVHGQMKPVRLLARQSPYYSNDSQWWSPDSYFEGGQIAAYQEPVSGTDDPELYQTERWGNFSYAIPVAPGRYSVWLHFAARHPDGASSPSLENAGRGHRFNVFCNGKALLENFDLPDTARQSDIVIRKFAGLEPNAQGKLVLSFVPVEGYASVAGIEVLPQ